MPQPEYQQAKDDHTIKLIYSCYQEDLIYQNPLYRHVAAQKLSI